jgi:two-component system cell cycle sensor histidine kinase/response regulator CckA
MFLENWMDEPSHANPAQLLLERLPLVTYLLSVDAPSPPLYVNKQVETLFGFALDELLEDGDYWTRQVVAEDRAALVDALAGLRAGGDPICVEYRLIRADGETVWVRDTASIQDGLVHGYVVDITRERELERELARERATLDAFFNDASIGLAITDGDGRYVRINEALARVNGRSAEEHVGATLSEIAPDVAAVIDPLRAQAEQARLFDVVLERDGEVAHKLLSLFPFTVGDERYHGRVVVDVTEQRRAEAAEQQFRLLIEQLPLAAYVNVARPQRRVLYVSPRIEELTGHSAQAFADDPLLGDSMIHPDDFEQIVTRERDARDRGQVFEHEYRIVRADGEIRWVLDRMETILDGNGDAAYEQGFLVDVTESHETANLLRAVWDGAFEAMVILDDEGRCVDANAAACELFGRTHDELLQLGVADMTEDVEGTRARWAELQATGAIRGELSIVRPDGTLREIEYATKANVRPGRHLSVARDVTERKQLEQQLWRAQKLESVGRLAGGVAHDFNNLLTAIRGYAQLLEARTPAGSVERHHAREIDRVADRAAALTAQLLALGRRQTLQPRPLDLNRLLAEMERALVELVGAEIDLALELDPALRAVRVDAGVIGQAIHNVVGNAADAIGTGGRISVRTANTTVAGRDDIADGSYVVLSVTDDGPGMDAEMREHVFEPFFTTKAHGEGSGLGLASAYGTVRQSGGTITVDSEPGVGSTFSIYLPEAAASEVAEPVPLGKGETVLVVEHDPAVRDVLFETLTDAGYRVLTARTVVDAQRLIERYEGTVDLALSERDVPGARTLAPGRPHTPDRLHRAVRDALESPHRGTSIPVVG